MSEVPLKSTIKTPVRRRYGGAGISSPFKSPLPKPIQTKNTLKISSDEEGLSSQPPASSNTSAVDTVSCKTHRSPLQVSALGNLHRSSDPLSEEELDNRITQLTSKLTLSRNLDTLNVDKELGTWRERMHTYNEAKDACLILLGRLAHLKMCTVSQLYSSYGLDLSD